MDEYIMLTDGESPAPGIGVFRKGDIRTLPEDVAREFVRQGVMKKLKAAKTEKGGKDNG